MIKLVNASLVVALLSAGNLATAQNATSTKVVDVPKGWHLLDKAEDGFQGISLDKAYKFVESKNLKGKTVVVAVIDSGIDTLHEDLKPILWKNPKEIPGNGKDDDGNGYVDDIHGWNFLGAKDGRNVKVDSYEGARFYHKFKSKYENADTATLSAEDKIQYNSWLKAKKAVLGDSDEMMDIGMLKRAYTAAVKSDSILRKSLNKDVFTGNDLDKFVAATAAERSAKGSMLYLFKANEQMESTNKEFMEGFGEFVSGQERKAEAKDHAPKDYRGEIVGDNEEDINDKYYGNNDVMASTPFHGTHVAGIIGAARKNSIGIDGVADNVKIMMIRAVPDGDEHDKDIALGIRYAVDNGAKVINMSFGKEFSPNKEWIDEAVKYAESKGVLLVHAAGNSAKNIDSTDNFPNALYAAQKGRATNWITVGASGDPAAGGITASFSNYGKDQVDVFAPGVKIYSTIPGGNTYGNAQGTSMASPVVAGTAAMLMSYFPSLSAQEIKYCIEKSATAPGTKVTIPGSGKEVDLSEISRTGGLINAYAAAQLASQIEEANQQKDQKAPKPVLKNKKG
jgi:subtilisin family serine protease